METNDSLRERLTAIKGVGDELADDILRILHPSDLDELKAHVRAGHLRRAYGVGEKMEHRIADALDVDVEAGEEGVAIADLLELDAEYRRKAEAGKLRKIAPKRNNPDNEAWLPIMYSMEGGRQYTVLFSNTDRAHELNKTDDWVVIYRTDVEPDEQWTVVTEYRGPLKGRRVVRGREDECRSYYEAT